MFDVLVASAHFVFGKARAATGAPGHRAVTLYENTSFVAGLQEVPDGSNVKVGIRKVAVFPVHPLTETLALLGDYSRKLAYSRHTFFGELIHTVFHNTAFVVYADFLFGLNFDPQPLRVETVLKLTAFSVHRVIFYVRVL